MDYWILNSTIAFLLCITFAGFLIPQILLISFRRNLFDEPDERKIHHGTVPRLGGIAFTPVICFSISLLLGMSILFGDARLLGLMTYNSRSLAFGFCALFLLYLVGMADDLIGIRYRAKFVVQIICSLLVIAGGLWVQNLYGLFGIHEIPDWVGIPLTILIMVYVINSINLIDGIDGLASGLSAAAFITYGVMFHLIGRHAYAMLSFACLGVLVPFFYFNVFGDPSRRQKIFMGDTGSLTIGLLLAFIGLELMLVSPDRCPVFGTNPLILALSPLIVPCFDVTRVFIHRVRSHGNPFLPDKTHIHHKLLALGLPQRIAMVTIVAVALLFNCVNILLSRYIDITLLLLLDIIVWTFANIILSNQIKKHNAKNNK